MCIVFVKIHHVDIFNQNFLFATRWHNDLMGRVTFVHPNAAPWWPTSYAQYYSLWISFTDAFLQLMHTWFQTKQKCHNPTLTFHVRSFDFVISANTASLTVCKKHKNTKLNITRIFSAMLFSTIRQYSRNPIQQIQSPRNDDLFHNTIPTNIFPCAKNNHSGGTTYSGAYTETSKWCNQLRLGDLSYLLAHTKFSLSCIYFSNHWTVEIILTAACHHHLHFVR